MKNNLRGLNLRTVCEESLCPNISECFSNNVATFMILGDVCTRQCAFCAVKKGKPFMNDKDEPHRVAKAVEFLGLKYVVVTSPSRDDLPDGGAAMFRETVVAIKKSNPAAKIEILIPDFSGNSAAIKKVCDCPADIISHNIETVPSLYKKIRTGAEYLQSLEVLKLIKKYGKKILTKSGIMLGLGETEVEVLKVFDDLRGVNCDFLTLGQYLAPSKRHCPVKEYITLEKFAFFEGKAYALGFAKVKSSPYVRSSYLAHDFLSSPSGDSTIRN